MGRIILILILLPVLSFGQTWLRSGLEAFVKFEEASGTDVRNETENSPDGTTIATVNQTGIIGNCYYYDGTHDRTTFSGSGYFQANRNG